MAAGRILLIVMFACAAALGPAGCTNNGGAAPGTEQITIAGQTFTLELAIDDESRRQGLSGRTAIPNDGGMLFIWPGLQTQRMWMYDCPVDIDVIFLDARGFVTATHEMKAEPPRRADESEIEYQQRLTSYSSRSRAQFAIELAAGSIDRLGVKVEDQVELDLERLKAYAK